MSRIKLIFSLILLITVVFCGQAAFAAVIDLWSAFPDTQGDNNFYAYGYNASRTVKYRLLSDTGAYSFSTPGQPSFYPTWSIPYVRRSGSPWIITHPSSIPQCATSYPPEDAVLGYFVAGPMVIDLSGRFEMTNTGNVRTYIKRNNTEIWSSVISNYGGADYNISSLNVYTNDMLYFGISANGDDYSDGTRFRGSISFDNGVIPEPMTLVLIGAGLLGMGLRKKKQII